MLAIAGLLLLLFLILAIQSSSYVKILFDIWIARNINETTSGLNPDIVTYLDALYHIKDYMEERGMVETRVRT